MAGSLFKGVGKLVGGLFGASQAPGQPSFNFFPNIITPSFNLKTDASGAVTLSRIGSPQRFPDILKQLSELGAQVRPGFGRFTEAAVEAIRRAKGDALGNAREQLQRRRIAGASFANAQLANIEQEFGRAEAQLRGQALLQEIQQTFQIIDAEAAVKTRNFQFELQELGIAAGVADSLLQVISDQTVIDKAIAAKAATNVGTFGADVGGLIGEGLGKFFGKGGGGEDALASLAGKLFGGSGGGSSELVGTFAAGFT